MTPLTPAGQALLQVPGMGPVYLDDGPAVVHAVMEGIRLAEQRGADRALAVASGYRNSHQDDCLCGNCRDYDALIDKTSKPEEGL